MDRRRVVMTDYLATGHPWEALFENWESEFLQMAAFVVLTNVLRSEGIVRVAGDTAWKELDDDPNLATSPISRCTVAGQARRLDRAPLYERRSAWRSFCSSSSLGPAMRSVALRPTQRAAGSRMESRARRSATTDVSPKFWFESFQNWQSEFLAIAAMVVARHRLRQRWSPESKPVLAPHAETGR